ncbi:hypothetical protein B0E43_06970 [Algoriphagus sp. A40]|nr:hypothetical protein B0E43_06970 [Algoriphagus sp. A40]
MIYFRINFSSFLEVNTGVDKGIFLCKVRIHLLKNSLYQSESREWPNLSGVLPAPYRATAFTYHFTMISVFRVFLNFPFLLILLAQEESSLDWIGISMSTTVRSPSPKEPVPKNCGKRVGVR